MSQRHPEQLYKQVAEVWLEAVESGWKTPGARTLTPDLAVAETWGVPRTTAHAWVKRARQLGLLTATMEAVGFCRPVKCPDCGGPMRHKDRGGSAGKSGAL